MIFPELRELSLQTVLMRTVKEFIDDEMSTYASALAYQMLFSLFPFILFLIALIGFLHLPDFFSWLRLQAGLVLPPQALDSVNPVIDQLQQSKGGLLSFGIVIALWTASAGVRLMMSAMNAAYDVVEERPVWKRIPLSIFYTVGIAGMLLAAAALMVLGPQVMGWLAGQIGLEDFIVTLWTIARWPVIVILMMIAVALIYYVMPDCGRSFGSSPQARCWPWWCGSSPRWALPSTLKRSPTTTPCTAASARSSCCCCISTSPRRCCCWAPR